MQLNKAGCPKGKQTQTTANTAQSPINGANNIDISRHFFHNAEKFYPRWLYKLVSSTNYCSSLNYYSLRAYRPGLVAMVKETDPLSRFADHL